MNFIDILLLVPLIYAAYKGFKHGLIIEAFTLLALFVGLYAGIHLSDFVAEKLKDVFHWDSEYLPVVAFTITFLGVGAMVYFAGKTIEQMVKVVNLSPVNKFFGALFGGIKMLYFVSVVLVIFESYDEKSHFFPEDKKEDSMLYNPVLNFSTKTVPGLEKSTIFLQNALQAESDSTGLSIEQLMQTKEVADSLGIEADNAAELKSVYNEHVRKN